jgi:hypothetical protein
MFDANGSCNRHCRIILVQPYPEFVQLPHHLELIGLISAAIGLAQLIVYWTDRKRKITGAHE